MPLTTTPEISESRGTWLDRHKLNRWLPIDKMQDAAIAFAESIGTRWDLIQGRRKPDQADDDDELYIQDEKGQWKIWPYDLRDIVSRFYRTAPDENGQQGSVAGRLLSKDLLMGAPSSATPLLFGLVPFFTFLILLVHGSLALSLLPILALLVTLSMIAISCENAGWAIVSGLCAALPLVSVGLVHLAGLGNVNADNILSQATLIPLGVIVGLAFLFGSKREARLSVGALLAVALLLGLTAFLPPLVRPLVLLLPGAWLGTYWSYIQMSQRAAHLQWQKKMCGWENSPNGTFHIAARKTQTLRAVKD